MFKIRTINFASERKKKAEGIKIVTEFLQQLESVASISAEQEGFSNIRFSHGAAHKQKTIFVVTDDGKTEGMFVEAYKSFRPLQTYDLSAEPGYLYTTTADYIFYLSDNTLFTLPTAKFRCWADRNTDAFRKECLVETNDGMEVHHHGFFIPKNRLRQDFAKGDTRVSIFRLRNPRTNDFDFVQEM